MSNPTRQSQERPVDHRIKRSHRRRITGIKKNLLWAMIILFVALIVGATVSKSSQFIEQFYGSQDENNAIPKDIKQKINGLDIDKLLRERDKLKR